MSYPRHLPRFGRLAIALVCLLSQSAQQQGMAQEGPTETAVLRGNQVTPDNLIQALTPSVPVKTRSLHVDREESKPAAVRRPSASLLITFRTSSADLTASARYQLDTVAAALKNDQLTRYSFDLEGHADRRGAADANRTLSQARAESVRDYLVKVHGISAERLAPIGKGDSEPINTVVVDAPENRRVTIVTRVP